MTLLEWINYTVWLLDMKTIIKNHRKVKTGTNKKLYVHNVLSVLGGINLAENGNVVCVLSQ